MSKKVVKNFVITKITNLSYGYTHIILTDDDTKSSQDSVDYSSIIPGQFVEVRVDESKTTFLRRPISVNYVDVDKRELHLLVRNAGAGTESLCNAKVGDLMNIMLPLGNGFSLNRAKQHPILVGGGVGVAPLLYLGKMLKDRGIEPTFLLAAKSADGLLLIDSFKALGKVYISTDDGSEGHPGLITENPVLKEQWDMIYCCGPLPMMKAVGRIATSRNIPCEVSLENTMACGLGACLCCVEDTVDEGNVCVCKEGPVFDVTRLKWQ